MLALKALLALSVNAVPIYGVFRLGWSASTVLALFWVENLLAAVLTTLRIFLHRIWTGKKGHWRGDELGVEVTSGGRPIHAKTFLGEYAMVAFPFTLVHGVFVVAICAILSGNYGDDPRFKFSFLQFQRGGAWMAAILVADLLVDIPRLRRGSFAWLKQTVQRRMGRVVVLHLAIIFGMFGMMMLDSPFSVVYVLFALKTLVDVGSSLKPANEEKSAAGDEEVVRG